MIAGFLVLSASFARGGRDVDKMYEVRQVWFRCSVVHMPQCRMDQIRALSSCFLDSCGQRTVRGVRNIVGCWLFLMRAIFCCYLLWVGYFVPPSDDGGIGVADGKSPELVSRYYSSYRLFVLYCRLNSGGSIVEHKRASVAPAAPQLLNPFVV